MGIGKEFVKKNSKYVIFEDGVAEGVFESMKAIEKESYGQIVNTIRYTLSGKTFDSASGKLAMQMDEVPIGKTVRITKTGKAADTKYVVQIL